MTLSERQSLLSLTHKDAPIQDIPADTVRGALADKTYGTPADTVCKQLAAFAVQALLEEAALFPKPGLVDPVSQGAHTDMDFTTLVRSAAALRQGFYECARIGYASLPRSAASAYATLATPGQPGTVSAHTALAMQGQPATAVAMQPDCAGGAVSAVRKQLQRTGLALEQAMFAETGGINTHKGAIFIFAYLLGAAGRLLHADHRSLSVSGGQHQLTAALCAEVQRLAAGSVAEWKTQLTAKQHYTHGERMFLQYGCCGIRGEVEAGLPLVNRNAAYPEECSLRLQQCISGQLPQRDAYLYTLLHIIAENEDTNVLFRAGPTALRDLQTRCASIIASGSTGAALYHAVGALDAYCIERHISPGGSADLFAAALFCRRVAGY